MNESKAAKATSRTVKNRLSWLTLDWSPLPQTNKMAIEQNSRRSLSWMGRLDKDKVSFVPFRFIQVTLVFRSVENLKN